MDRYCYRCNKLIERPEVILPNGKKSVKAIHDVADYVIAEDTKVDEPREVFIALKHTKETLKKVGKQEIKDEEYEQVEISSLKEAVDAVKVISIVKIKSIQKTGLVCSNCYKPTDFIIWGIHKK